MTNYIVDLGAFRWSATDSLTTWLSLRSRRRWWANTATWERWAATIIYWHQEVSEICWSRWWMFSLMLRSAMCSGASLQSYQALSRWNTIKMTLPWQWWHWWFFLHSQVIFSDSVCRDCGEKVGAIRNICEHLTWDDCWMIKLTIPREKHYSL